MSFNTASIFNKMPPIRTLFILPYENILVIIAEQGMS
jgi:hypothetical protein